MEDHLIPKGNKEDLLKVVQEYLVESVRLYGRKRLNLSILNGVTAIELLLKSKLWKINQALIWADVDGKRDKKFNTVGLTDLPTRLKRCGHKLDEQEETLINTLCDYRNQVAHFVPQFSDQDASTRILQMFDFITGYLHREFGTDIRYRVPTKAGLTAREAKSALRAAQKDVAQRVKQARLTAKSEGNVEHIEACPSCGYKKTMTKRDGDAYCHFCQKDIRIVDCGQCDRPAYTDSIYGHQKPHDKCMENFDPPDMEPWWK